MAQQHHHESISQHCYVCFVQKNDVDIEKFMSILRPSALYAPTFDKKLQRMLDRDFANPNFPTKHLLKDVRLFEKEAQVAALDTALLQGLERVIESTVARGLDFTDYSAVRLLSLLRTVRMQCSLCGQPLSEPEARCAGA